MNIIFSHKLNIILIIIIIIIFRIRHASTVKKIEIYNLNVTNTIAEHEGTLELKTDFNNYDCIHL